MKKLILIAVLLFLISACKQATKEANYIERKDNTSAPVVNKENTPMEIQVNDMQVKEVIEPTSFGEILGIINEVEQIICEGDCSKVPSLTQPQADAIKFRNEVEASLGIPIKRLSWRYVNDN